MTKKITVIVEADLDNQTVKVSDDHKVGSMFLLTSQAITIPPTGLRNLIFRKSKNSNFPMFCTGYQLDEDWYGDRPDDGIWINSFENNQKYKRTGETDVRYTPDTPQPKPSEDKPNRLILKETYSGVQVIVESKNDDLGSLPSLENVTYNGNNLGEVSAWEALPDATGFFVQTSATVLLNQNSATLEFTYNEHRYRVTLPKVADDGGAGTFAIEFDRNNQFYTSITTESSFVQIS